MLRRTICLGLRPYALGALLAAFALLWSRQPALAAFPPPGTDQLPVTGQASVSSRIGQETIPLAGTVTFQRGATQMQGGMEVVPAEIIAMSLQGTSVTGPVSIAESSTLASTGELRALQPSSSFPASSFFDVFVVATAPASTGTPTVTSIALHNNATLHMVASTDLIRWPPASATYAATPNPCVALFPSLPKGICITSLTFTVGGGVGGITELPDIATAAASERGVSEHPRAIAIAFAAAGAALVTGVFWCARRLVFRR